MDALTGVAGIIFVIALWIVGAAAYFAPSIVAFIFKARNLGVVVVINFVFGWTVIGWVVALVFAIWNDKKPEPAGWVPQQPWPQPYPYGPPPQQIWPAQPPMWHTDAATPPYGNPQLP